MREGKPPLRGALAVRSKASNPGKPTLVFIKRLREDGSIIVVAHMIFTPHKCMKKLDANACAKILIYALTGFDQPVRVSCRMPRLLLD